MVVPLPSTTTSPGWNRYHIFRKETFCAEKPFKSNYAACFSDRSASQTSNRASIQFLVVMISDLVSLMASYHCNVFSDTPSISANVCPRKSILSARRSQNGIKALNGRTITVLCDESGARSGPIISRNILSNCAVVMPILIIAPSWTRSSIA